VDWPGGGDEAVRRARLRPSEDDIALPRLEDMREPMLVVVVVEPVGGGGGGGGGGSSVVSCQPGVQRIETGC
jgi:hypothetical protein